ncbi:MAG: hypothetical protein R3A51_14875 [Nannocystaceae bacterium]|nr:hypothetical protein [Myxococcales bacterium]
MSLLPATLRHDIRLQARSKLYGVGVGVALAFGVVARLIFAREDAGAVLAAFYLLAVGGTAYVFGATVVLLERGEGTLLALRVTPLTSRVYIASKAITLTGFAVIESAIVYAVGFLGAPLRPLPMIVGVIALGLLYALIGLGQVAPHRSVTAFMIPGALVIGGILQLPVFYVLEIGPPQLYYAIPSQGPLLLMLGSSTALAPWQWVYALVTAALAIVVAGFWAMRRFARHVALQEG